MHFCVYIIVLNEILVGSYKIGKKGTMNCPDGFIIVDNEDECRLSAPQLGMPFAAVGCWVTETTGCIYNGESIYFSNCAQSSTLVNHAAVCKIDGKYIYIYTVVHLVILFDQASYRSTF